MVETKRLLHRFRRVVLAFLIASLGLYSIAPAGYMIAPSAMGWPAVVVCPETHPLAQFVDSKSVHASAMDHAVAGHEEGGEHKSSASPAKDCAFAGGTQLATGPIDPELLAIALAFLLVLGLASSPPIVLNASRHLRPPPRAPPVRI